MPGRKLSSKNEQLLSFYKKVYDHLGDDGQGTTALVAAEKFYRMAEQHKFSAQDITQWLKDHRLPIPPGSPDHSKNEVLQIYKNYNALVRILTLPIHDPREGDPDKQWGEFHKHMKERADTQGFRPVYPLKYNSDGSLRAHIYNEHGEKYPEGTRPGEVGTLYFEKHKCGMTKRSRPKPGKDFKNEATQINYRSRYKEHATHTKTKPCTLSPPNGQIKLFEPPEHRKNNYHPIGTIDDINACVIGNCYYFNGGTFDQHHYNGHGSNSPAKETTPACIRKHQKRTKGTPKWNEIRAKLPQGMPAGFFTYKTTGRAHIVNRLNALRAMLLAKQMINAPRNRPIFEMSPERGLIYYSLTNHLNDVLSIYLNDIKSNNGSPMVKGEDSWSQALKLEPYFLVKEIIKATAATPLSSKDKELVKRAFQFSLNEGHYGIADTIMESEQLSHSEIATILEKFDDKDKMIKHSINNNYYHLLSGALSGTVEEKYYPLGENSDASTCYILYCENKLDEKKYASEIRGHLNAFRYPLTGDTWIHVNILEEEPLDDFDLGFKELSEVKNFWGETPCDLILNKAKQFITEGNHQSFISLNYLNYLPRKALNTLLSQLFKEKPLLKNEHFSTILTALPPIKASEGLAINSEDQSRIELLLETCDDRLINEVLPHWLQGENGKASASVETLLEQQLTPSLLDRALLERKEAFSRWLLKKGINPFEPIEGSKHSPFDSMIEHQLDECIQLIFEEIAEKPPLDERHQHYARAENTSDKVTPTALHRVIKKECFETAVWLLENDADMFALNSDGETPFSFAASANDSRLFARLLEDMVPEKIPVDQRLDTLLLMAKKMVSMRPEQTTLFVQTFEKLICHPALTGELKQIDQFQPYLEIIDYLCEAKQFELLESFLNKLRVERKAFKAFVADKGGAILGQVTLNEQMNCLKQLIDLGFSPTVNSAQAIHQAVDFVAKDNTSYFEHVLTVPWPNLSDRDIPEIIKTLLLNKKYDGIPQLLEKVSSESLPFDPATLSEEQGIVFTLAIQHQQWALIKRLFAYGFPKNAAMFQENLTEVNTPSAWSVLVQHAQLDSLALIIEHGDLSKLSEQDAALALLHLTRGKHFELAAKLAEKIHLLKHLKTSQKVDPDTQQNPLHYALSSLPGAETPVFDRQCERENRSMTFFAKHLVKMGVNLYAKNSEGLSPLDLLFEKNQFQLAQELLFKSFEINEPFQRIESARTFVRAKDRFNSNRTYLHKALKNTKGAFASWLLLNGADLNELDAEGHTPLFYAMENYKRGLEGSAALLLDLLSTAKESDISDSNLQRIILESSKNRLSDSVCNKALERLHAAPMLTDEQGNTALHYAVKTSDNKLCEQLLKHGSSPSIENKEGKTPLQWAMDLNRVDLLLTLLKNAELTEQELDRMLLFSLERIVKKGRSDKDSIAMSRLILADQRLTTLRATSCHGNTAAHLAISTKVPRDIRKSIFKKSANLLADYKTAQTVFDGLMRAKNFSVIKKVIGDHGQLLPKEMAGRYLWYFMEQRKHSIAAKLLNKVKACDFKAYRRGENALYFALINKQYALCQQMLRKGADLNARDLQGKTLLSIALSSKAFDKKELLELIAIAKDGPHLHQDDPLARWFVRYNHPHELLLNALKKDQTNLVQWLCLNGANPTETYKEAGAKKDVITRFLESLPKAQRDCSARQSLVLSDENSDDESLIDRAQPSSTRPDINQNLKHVIHLAGEKFQARQWAAIAKHAVDVGAKQEWMDDIKISDQYKRRVSVHYWYQSILQAQSITEVMDIVEQLEKPEQDLLIQRRGFFHNLSRKRSQWKDQKQVSNTYSMLMKAAKTKVLDLSINERTDDTSTDRGVSNFLNTQRSGWSTTTTKSFRLFEAIKGPDAQKQQRAEAMVKQEQKRIEKWLAASTGAKAVAP